MCVRTSGGHTWSRVANEEPLARRVLSIWLNSRRFRVRLYVLIVAGVLVAAVVPTALVAVTAVVYAHGITTEILIGSAVGLSLATILALTLAHRVTRPLIGFREFAMSIARGQFGGQIAYGKDDELGELAKTFNYMSASIEAYDAETQRLADDVEAGYLETIVALANSLDSKDPYTRGHGQRVAEMAVAIGRELKLSEQELKRLKYGGILHDIGKIGIVETILLKQTRLNEAEMETMRAHPLIGDHIIKPVRLLSTISAAVRNHHEWWNGAGYPDRLKGEAIPLMARIIAVADTWDACTSTRPYQVALSEEEALAVIDRLDGNHLDPTLVQSLKQVIADRKSGSRQRPESVKKAG
jgi:HD-GYP domain-containing protein (c-di-GMP phosphodiesterase class II)